MTPSQAKSEVVMANYLAFIDALRTAHKLIKREVLMTEEEDDIGDARHRVHRFIQKAANGGERNQSVRQSKVLLLLD